MKTAEEMTLDLQLVFDELKAGQIKYKDAAELTNCVGKMIGLAKVQLEYYTLRKEIPKLIFLETTRREPHSLKLDEKL